MIIPLKSIPILISCGIFYSGKTENSLESVLERLKRKSNCARFNKEMLHLLETVTVPIISQGAPSGEQTTHFLSNVLPVLISDSSR